MTPYGKEYIELLQKHMEKMSQDIGGLKADTAALKTDIALIRTNSEYTLAFVKRMDEMHNQTRIETNTRIIEHEKRIADIEKQQITWKGYIGGIVLCFSTFYAIVRLIEHQ
jgi:hypothetical protein